MAKQYQNHPAADLFPMMDDAGFEALKTDIQQRGQIDPIELFDGEILDGRNRYRACSELGIDPKCRELSECEDPISYVLSRNLHRRHLDAGQRAMVAARVRDHYAKQAKDRQRDHGKTAPGKRRNTSGKRTGSDSRDAAGKAVGVSGKYVDTATKILQSGKEEVIAAVERGEMSLPQAVLEVKGAKPKSNRQGTQQQQPVSMTNKDRCTKLIIDTFADGAWHDRSEIIKKATEAGIEDAERTTKARLVWLVKGGMDQVLCLSNVGAAEQRTYRILKVPGERVSRSALLSEIGPLLDSLEAQGKKDRAHNCPRSVYADADRIRVLLFTVPV